MKVILITYVLIIILSCSNKVQPKLNFETCNKENAIKVAENSLKKWRLYHDVFVYEFEELDSVFVFTLLPKDTNRLGGGGKFIISKDECKIIDGEVFQ